MSKQTRSRVSASPKMVKNALFIPKNKGNSRRKNVQIKDNKIYNDVPRKTIATSTVKSKTIMKAKKSRNVENEKKVRKIDKIGIFNDQQPQTSFEIKSQPFLTAQEVMLSIYDPKKLLSARKPLNINQNGNVESKSRKKVRFGSDTLEKVNSPTFIPLPKTPMPKSQIKNVVELVSKKQFRTRIPIPIRSGLKNKEDHISKIIIKNSNLPKTFSIVEGVKPMKKKILFKKETVTRENLRTMVATKSTINQLKNLKNKNRFEITNVRTNKRFDLLMKMRLKNV